MISIKDIQSSIEVISSKYLVGRCEKCGDKNASLCPSMTAYFWDKTKTDEDPNGDVFLCSRCHEEYVSYWTGKWDQRNQGRFSA